MKTCFKTQLTELRLPGSASIELTLQSAVTGPPGPVGAMGPAGSASLIVPAGEALGGHRCVILNVSGAAFYADCTNPNHFGRFAGITTGAAAMGENITVVDRNLIDEPSWSWIVDKPVFLGQNGLLTQTPPAIGFQQVVGIALSPTTIFINPREPLVTN